MRKVSLENMIHTIYMDGIKQEIEQQVKVTNVVNVQGDFKVVDRYGNPIPNKPTIDDSFDSFFREFH